MLEYAARALALDELMYTFPLASQEMLLTHARARDRPAQPAEAPLHERPGPARSVRIADSPGLDTTITEQAPDLRRPTSSMASSARSANANIGLVRFESIDGIGDVRRPLRYSFPVDQPPKSAWLGPQAAEPSFRDDWIITRHAAGLTVGRAADVGVWAGE